MLRNPMLRTALTLLLVTAGLLTWHFAQAPHALADDPTPVTVQEFAFTPNALTATAGQQTSITITNKGGSIHTFTIDGLVDAGVIASGTSNTVQFTAAAGTYTYYCAIHGAGVMSGTLTVS